jgi:hypothetical protein
MMTVPLHSRKHPGLVALIDDADLGLVQPYTWCPYAPKASRTFYAVAKRRDGVRSVIRMHKLITGWPRTDHQNHDGLDNQRSNLRPATNAQNSANSRPRLGAASSYKGVCWLIGNQKWRAEIMIDGHHRHLGCFAAEEDAARAYDAAALETWGEFAYLNFDLGRP